MFRWVVAHVSRRPRGFAVVCALLVGAALMLDGTFAWFTGVDSRVNPLRVPQLVFHVSAVDEFTPPQTPPTPGGAAIPKRVGATNDGDLRAVVRLLALPQILAADGETVLPARLGGEVEADMESLLWVPGGDGYYYWIGVLAPGETTEDLFTEVKLKSGLAETYEGAKLIIEIKTEASVASVRDYRLGWWGSESAPTDATLAQIDGVLSAMVSAP